MYDKKISGELINSMKSAYNALLSLDPDTPNDSLIITWKRIGDENVQYLSELLKTAHLTVGEKLHVLTTTAHLKSLSAKFEEHQHQRNRRWERRQSIIDGGNIGTNDNFIQWDNAETAFNNRINTGIFTN
ncbi:hypothetical protein PV327_011461 [Microctonus hyperodae]|uniref:Uncharacterized protein n=1 Tax=Microctonus hyperodae TaxID=165561 RepID=A0AA39C326_MICHY|nr:hypothetical protein PV327_011461 [Microctonus hyperodae]